MAKRTNGKATTATTATADTGKGKGKQTARKPAAPPTIEAQATIVGYGRQAKPIPKAKGYAIAPHKIVHSGVYGIAKKAIPYNAHVLAVLRMLAKKGIVGPQASLTSGELAPAAVTAAIAVGDSKKWADGGYAVRHSVYCAVANGHAEVYTSPTGKPTYALTTAGAKAIAKMGKA